MFKGLAVLLFLLSGGVVQAQEVFIEANSPTAFEEGTVPGRFRVYTTAIVNTPIDVTYSVAGTATPGSDYTALSGSTTLPISLFFGSESFIDVTGIVDDALIEGNETVVVTIKGVTGGGGTIAAPPNDMATVTIEDNDYATINISDPPPVTEGNSGVQNLTFTVSIDRADPIADVSVNYAISGGNQNGTNSSLSFSAGATVLSQDIIVTTNGDLLIEPDEVVTVTLSNPSANAQLAADSVGSSSFLNDDFNTITLGPVVGVTHPEGNGGTTSFAFTATRTGDTSGTASVDYAVTGSGPNPANGADFVGGTLPASSVNFVAGSATAQITINVNGDTAIEPDETFTVTLSNPSAGAVLGTPVMSVGTITNDDSNTITLGPVVGVTHPEGNGGTTSFAFTATRTGDTSGTASVDYAVTGSGPNPANGADFVGGTLPASSVNFVAGSATAQITINVNGDTAIEPDETFTVTLSNPSAGAVLGTPVTSVGTITNDDSNTITLGPVGGVTHPEGNGGTTSFAFTATRTGDTSGTASVDYAVTGSGPNPANGADFVGGTLPASSVNFVAGSATAQITINVNGDTAIEPDETFTVTLSNPSAGAVLGNPISQVGTITNDDSNTITLGPVVGVTHPEGNSGPTPYVFTATRTGDTSGTASVDYAVTGSGPNPANGADFVGGTLPASSVNFVAGSATAQITINVNGDTAIEPDETFTVTLSNPSAGAVLGTPVTSVGTITNDDTGIAIQTAGVTHPEGNNGPRAFAFTVTRSGNLSLANSVAYAVTGSGPNPANGADFVGGTLPASSVNFGAGSATATITINVNGDRLVEPNETFTVTLSNPTNGAALGNATAIGTITNDDSCAAGTTAPVLDSSVPTAYCNIVNRDLDDFTNSPVPPNSVLVWSTNSNPLIVADHLVGSIATTAGTYYGFFYDSLNNCASSTLQVTLTLNTSPFAGPDVNVAACNSTDTGGSTTLDLDLQLTGEDPGGTWTITTDPSGGMIIGAGNVVDFSGLAVNSVYVFTYTTNNAVAPCVNDTATVSVTVTDCTCPAGNVAPVLDTSVPTAFCDIIAQDLNEYTNSVPPAGTALTWSTNPDPTVANAHIFSNVDAPGTYYGFFYDAVDNCGSPVLTVNLTINTTPEVLTTIPGSRCGIGTVTLGGTRDPGAVLNWWDSETGGTFLGTGTSFVTPSIAETTTFYVEATANGCTSERTAVIATVYEQPNPGVANNTSACSLAEGFTTIDLNTRLVGADPGVWTITSVPTGSTVTIGPNNIVDFVGQPDGDYIFTYTTNTAQAPCTDPSTTLTVSVSPSDCAPNDIDLELVKQVDKGSVDVGGQVTFTLALTNLSDIQATNIIVSDPLGISYGFPYVASTPSKGTYNNITGEWAIDVLEPHESISLILVASVPVEGTFTNMAMITASFPNDGNPANNESSVEVEVLSTVCLQIFNQISPNGDGINDEFIINCIRNYKNNKLEIFDRYGNKVFSKTNYDNTWSGTGKNGDLPKGTYFYSLDLGDGSAGKTGWIQIIR